MIAHIDDFLLNLQANNYSIETVYNYERDLQIFDNFLVECKIDFVNLNKRTIIYYKAYLVSRDRITPRLNIKGKILDSSSVNRMLSSIRGYLRYLIDMDYDCPIPPESVKLTKTVRKHPQVAELHDLVRLVEAPSSLESNSKLALRNRAMLELLLATGMRISELCNLNRSQIDDSGRIFITGKGNKQRFVYLTPRATQQLNLYLRTRLDDCPALFIPYSGRNINNPRRRISTNYLQERIKRYREKLKIMFPLRLILYATALQLT